MRRAKVQRNKSLKQTAVGYERILDANQFFGPNNLSRFPLFYDRFLEPSNLKIPILYISITSASTNTCFDYLTVAEHVFSDK